MRLIPRDGAFRRPTRKLLSDATKPQRNLPYSPRRSAHQFVTLPELRPTPNPRAQNVAVLGGGITGLAAAFQIARTIPHAKVTIFDKNDRLGGWLNSEVIEVDGGEVLFEWGPRTIRPDVYGPGVATAALLTQLGLHEHVIGIGKKSLAATNRFIYYPDHMVRMPGPDPSGSPLVAMAKAAYTVLTEPLFKGTLMAVACEPAVKVRGPQVADESVGAFLSRRFGRTVADNLASAVFHGIYAGDIDHLSARTLLPMLWHAETRDTDGNGVIAEFADMFFKNQYMRKYSDVNFSNLSALAQDVPKDDIMLQTFVRSIGKDVSVYTFGRGTGHLTEELKRVLAQNPNIRIQTATAVESLDFDPKSKQIQISTDKGSSDGTSYDYVVSTLSPLHLKEQLSASKNSSTTNHNTLEHDINKASEAADVMVVNLYYSNPDLLAIRGFGYLIPRTIPVEQNPERALGVIFGSETSGVRGPEAVQKVGKPTPEMVKLMEDQIEDCRQKVDDPDREEGERHRLKSTLETLTKSFEGLQEDLNNPEDKFIRLGQDTAPGTKLTVMMGGHWWKGWQESDFPTEEEGIEMAKRVLARHLKIEEAPTIAKARLNRNCIPQYRPGYRQTMAAIHKEVLKDFQGRLKLAGTWWQGGVGVNDCVRKARLAAFSIREQWDERTGLEEYCEQEKYVIGDTRTGQVVMDPLQ